MQNNSSFLGKMVVTKALAKQPVKGLIYFLHGACDSGLGLQSWVNKTVNGNFAFKNFPVLYPSSPIRSYTLHDGKKEAIWFDQAALSQKAPEDLGSIKVMGEELTRLIKDGGEENGVPEEKVIIGGFSMGGTMALHLAYQFNPKIAGVFALSSFLPCDSRLYEEMEMKAAMNSIIRYDDNNNPLNDEDPFSQVKFPKLFMSHGKKDPIVPLKWAKRTFTDLRMRGVSGHFYTMEHTQHAVSKTQLGLLHDWISETLSEKSHRKSRTSAKKDELS